jgi:hypothetical protein
MPVFFFDIHDGKHLIQYEEGQAMASPEAARVEAVCTLLEMAAQVIPKASGVEYTACVRDEQHKIIFTATLSVCETWLA